MKLTLSHGLRKTAEFLIYAAGLTLEDLNVAIEQIKIIMEDENNFLGNKESPLALNKNGISKLNVLNSAIRDKDIPSIIKKLDKAIQTGAFENDELKNINEYVVSVLRNKKDGWVNVDVKGMDFNSARKTILDKSLDPFTHAANNLTLTPKTRKFEKDIPKSKGMSEKKYRKTIRPHSEPASDFNPRIKPMVIKPERVVERSPR